MALQKQDTEGSEDVNDFLLRIRELGDKRDREDEERTRKLEEEILQGRRERQARRAERARSISPTKDSPLLLDGPIPRNALSSNSIPQSIDPPVDLFPSPRPVDAEMKSRDDDTNKPKTTTTQSLENGVKPTLDDNNVPALSRTLSWNRRPGSRQRNMKTTDSTRLPEEQTTITEMTSNVESMPTTEAEPELSRSQIAQSLGSKDPSWFKQTSDRGNNSQAYKRPRNTTLPDATMSAGSIKLPGIGKEPNADLEPPKSSDQASERSSSPSRTSSAYGASSFGHRYSSTSSVSTGGLGSAMPLSAAHRLDSRPQSIYEDPKPVDRVTMSPSQGRITNERPSSPTKGMGGFVQSAMLKRSDSVSKRWSAQPGSNTLRGNITPTTRGESTILKPPPQIPLGSSDMSDETSLQSNSRPGSSHSEMTVVRHSVGEDKFGSADSTRARAETISSGGFSKATIRPSSSRRSDSISTLSGKNPDIPVTPSKTMDPKRWSPTKASWLESALSKPDSPKLKPITPQEPEWKKGLTDRLRKAKETSQTEKPTSNENKPPGEESPKPEPKKPSPKPEIGSNNPELDHLSGNSRETEQISNSDSSQPNSTKDLPRSPPIPAKNESLKSGVKAVSRASNPSPLGSPVERRSWRPSSPEKPSPDLASPKPNTETPATDLRTNLRPRKYTNSSATNEEPEFKAVFGKLRRTETKNYVAPDKLKDNIMRGKAGLAMTGGPKKTERVDEFKESILKRKEAMKAGGGSIRDTINDRGIEKSSPASQSPVPEAIAMRNKMGRSNSIKNDLSAKPTTVKPAPKPLALRSPSEEKPPAVEPTTEKPADSISQPPKKVQSPPPQNQPIPTKKEPTLPAGKMGIAGRLNPSLANLIARGPASPSTKSSPAPSSSQNSAETSSTTLTHMTKSRAKGPKRRLPQKAKQTSTPTVNEGKSLPSIITHNKETTKPLGEQSPQKKKITPTIGQQEGSGVQTEPRSAGIPKEPQSTDVEKLERKVFPDGFVNKNKSPSTEANAVDHTHDSTEILLPIRYNANGSSETLDSPKFSRSSTTPVAKEKPSPPPKSSTLPSRAISGARKSDESPQQSQKPRPIVTPEKKPHLAHPKPDLNRKTSDIETTKQPLTQTETPKSASVSPVVPSKSAAVLSMKPARPASISPFPQLSEATKLFSEFFDTPPSASNKVEIDPQSILLAKQHGFPKFNTLKKQVWELSGDGKRKDLPGNQEYILFEENMYLCVHTFEKSKGTKHTEVHLWCGDGVGEATIEDAQLFARKVARENNCRLELLKQGKETTSFIQALGGIIIIRRGSSTRADSSARYMLCGRRHMGQISFDEVDQSPNSLCSGYPFIIAAKFGKLYLWQGKGSAADELGCARLISMDIGLTGDIEQITEGQEPKGFFDIFEDQDPSHRPAHRTADHWRLKPKHEKYCCRLYRVDHELGQRFGASFWNRRGTSSPVSRPNDTVQEIEPFCQRDLDPAHIYVLDTFFEIYVIVGDRATSRFAEFASALVFAQEYSILAVSEQDRPFLPKGSVVLHGMPDECKAAFRKWDDRATSNRDKSPIVLPLGAAIEAIR